jgi:hypothetical protein
MEILKLLDGINRVKRYEIEDYKQWSDGFYYRLKAVFTDESVLFAKEYFDTDERNYAFHWQSKENILIMRWDNAPHHHEISTFPHHKHSDKGISENTEISIIEVLEIIRKRLLNDAAQ